MIAMNNLKSNEASTEVKCSACNGTGFPPVAQPAQAGRNLPATLQTVFRQGADKAGLEPPPTKCF
jgi:hypothetical protein